MMNELQNAPKKAKKSLGGDKAQMKGLLSMLNNPALTGAQVPQGVNPMAGVEAVDARGATIIGEPIPVTDSQPTPPAPAPTPPSVPKQEQVPQKEKVRASSFDLDRVFFTGVLKSGKDFVAERAGFSILGFADPIYRLVEVMFGIKVNANEGKDLPGVRALLQQLGQYGRNEVNEKYPYTIGRALTIRLVKELADTDDVLKDFQVEWGRFGEHQDLWLDSLVRRADLRLGEEGVEGIAATNVRFENEFKRLASEGWAHYHVMCSPETRNERLAAGGMSSTDPALKDVSERLAHHLDQQVLERVKREPKGKMLHVIWNDPKRQRPSQRLFTVDQFLSDVALYRATEQEAKLPPPDVNIGEV